MTAGMIASDLTSWVRGADDSGFPIQNLPYGSFSTPGSRPRIGCRIGDFVLDLGAAAEAGLLDGTGAERAVAQPRLNDFMAGGRAVWQRTRVRLANLLRSGSGHAVDVDPLLVALGGVTMHLPIDVADYVDFYSCREHATNLGRMFRPGAPPLMPNWSHLPVGYHGRSSTFVVSGSAVRRPSGQRLEPGADRPVFGPSTRLDFELELGFVIGVPSELGEPVPTAAARDHVFGVVLLNDWSARDIQAWEYQPLGPHLGKSFATSISPWVVPLDALEPWRVSGPTQDPPVQEYLKVDEDWAFDLRLEIALSSRNMREAGLPSQIISRTGFRHLYWNPAQHLAHTTVNGACLRPGDLHASGTVSEDRPDALGSMIELTWNGERPLRVADGTERSFLLDGDSVVLSGSAGPLSLGAVEGTVA